MKRQAKERKKKEEEVLKEVERLVAQVQAVKDTQRKAAEGYKAEVDSLMSVNRDSLPMEDLIKLEEKLK